MGVILVSDNNIVFVPDYWYEHRRFIEYNFLKQHNKQTLA